MSRAAIVYSIGSSTNATVAYSDGSTESFSASGNGSGNTIFNTVQSSELASSGACFSTLNTGIRNITSLTIIQLQLT